jgi:hypothetical protein
MIRRNRYENFSGAELKIHPLKRLAGFLARRVPRRWRFRLFGLPPRSQGVLARENGADRLAVERGIACRNGTHLDASGAYLPEMSLGPDHFIESRFLQKQRLWPRIRRVEGTLLSLASEGDTNYYRWLMETLPRFRFIEEGGMKFDRLYARQDEPFHRTSLAVLGVAAEAIVASGDNPFVQGARLTMPRFVNESESWIIPWLRERILPAAGKSDGKAERIYITRAKAHSRRLANEAELLRALEPLDVRPVVLEEMEWLDQVRLFQRAELVVAPHGAGLANLVFASPGTLAVELIAPEYEFTAYPEICRQLKIGHHLVACEALELRRVHASDVRVDVAGVVALLR